MSAPIQGLIGALIADARARSPNQIPLIGVAGAQGSGKSYQCRKFVEAHPRVAHFSLDDVYLTKAERVRRAAIERLPLTRGPPGTHDLHLANAVIAGLMRGATTKLPRFAKAADDRAPENTWPSFDGEPEAILIDGWCLGAKPTSLGGEPLNDLEREDEDGIWRRETVKQLGKAYAPFFATFSAILYLRPPSWDVVKAWRAEQEIETLGRPLHAGDHARLDRFMMHFERITRSMMDGEHIATIVAELDEARQVVRVREHSNPLTPRA